MHVEIDFDTTLCLCTHFVPSHISSIREFHITNITFEHLSMRPDPRMALFSVSVILCTFYALSTLPCLAARQTLILMSGESCLVYSLIIVTPITSVLKIK